MIVGFSVLLLTSPVGAQPDPTNYQVTFNEVIYDEVANVSTWYYTVCSLGPPAISHIVFEFKTCDPDLFGQDLLIGGEGSLEGGTVKVELVDPDPTTGKSGIKFEFEFTTNPEPETWCATVQFTLEGLWDENGIEVFVKAGSDGPWPSYDIPGPSCFVIPEPATIGAVATSLLALVAYAARRRNAC